MEMFAINSALLGFSPLDQSRGTNDLERRTAPSHAALKRLGHRLGDGGEHRLVHCRRAVVKKEHLRRSSRAVRVLRPRRARPSPIERLS